MECDGGTDPGGPTSGGSSGSSTESTWKTTRAGSLCEASFYAAYIGEAYYFAIRDLDIGFANTKTGENYVIRLSEICIRTNNNSSDTYVTRKMVGAFDRAVESTEAWLDFYTNSLKKVVTPTDIRETLKLMLEGQIPNSYPNAEVHFNFTQCQGAIPQKGLWGC
jgi:hypothetical protein